MEHNLHHHRQGGLGVDSEEGGGEVFASRSHAIEYAVRQFMRQERARANPTRPGRQ